LRRQDKALSVGEAAARGDCVYCYCIAQFDVMKTLTSEGPEVKMDLLDCALAECLPSAFALRVSNQDA